jgi:hypothetical protein
MEAGTDEDRQKYLQAIIALFRTSIEPYDLTEEVNCGGQTRMFPALLHRRKGQIKDAASTLRPYMEQCISMAFTYRIGGREVLGDIVAIRSLGEALLALNHFNDALGLFRYMHDVTGW